MTKWIAAPMGVALAVGLLAGCSKPPSKADTETAQASASAPGAPGGAIEPVSPPGNGAVNADANKGQDSLSPGANSFTESEARSHIEKAGYTDVGALAMTPDGVWTGRARKGGQSMDVSVDFKGAVHAVASNAVSGQGQ